MSQQEHPRELGTQRGLAPPVLIWLAIQFGALLLAGLQVPLADKFPRPIERQAIQEMLVVQIAFSAMLFPLLLDGPWATLAAIAAAWPMLALAGVLSVRPAADLMRAALFLSLWLAMLGVWRWILHAPRARLVGCAVATTLSVGGVLLAYAQVEFDVSAVTTWEQARLAGPIRAALLVVESWDWNGWSWLVCAMGATLASAGAKILMPRIAIATYARRTGN